MTTGKAFSLDSCIRRVWEGCDEVRYLLKAQLKAHSKVEN